MKILNKIRNCIFTTKTQERFSQVPNLQTHKLSEEEKIQKKINLIAKYLREGNLHEEMSLEIHQIIKKIEEGYKKKA